MGPSYAASFACNATGAVVTSRPPPAAAIAEHQRALAAKVLGVMTVNCYECAIGLLIARSPLTEVLCPCVFVISGALSESW